MKQNKTIIEEAKDDKLREIAEKFVAEIYRENQQLYRDASKLVEKLGLGGLWRGIDLAMMNTIMALQKQRDLQYFETKEAEQSASKVSGNTEGGLR